MKHGNGAPDSENKLAIQTFPTHPRFLSARGPHCLWVSSDGYMMNLTQMTFVAIDFETAHHQWGSACAVGLAVGCDGRIVASWSSLIRPLVARFSFSGVHGLHWEDVRDAPTFSELWPVLCSWIEDAEFLAAHNASFDSSVLRACCATHGVLAPRMPFTCTVQLARKQWKIYPTKLPDVCRALRIPLRHHDSGSDAEACARIVLAAEAEGWQPRRRRVSRTHADQGVTSRNGENLTRSPIERR